MNLTTRLPRTPIGTTLAACVVLVSTAGCGTLTGNTSAAEPSSPLSCTYASSLVLLVSVHQGAAAPQLPQSAECSVRRAIQEHAPISIVTIEGSPRVLLNAKTWELNDGQPEKDNPEAYADDRAAAQAEVGKVIRTATASSDGNDLTAAVAMAADQSRVGRTGPSAATLIVADTGYSDRGAVNMTRSGMSAAEPADVADMVKRTNSCPTLAGTQVVLTGFGYSASPQPALPLFQKNNITKIWQDTFSACGAKATVAPEARTGSGPRTSHTVMPVPAASEPTLPSKPQVGSSLVFRDSGTLRFAPDSADLLDPNAADETLEPFATYLKSSRQHQVTVTGTTANGSTRWASLKALGLARADRIKSILVKLGATAEQVTTVGLGYTANPPVTDPATAALNRSIRIEVTR
ncbi:OmpA family protein [Arsenicicoccus bolidensis]|uniref:OmpA family protein n=1 Tax=Arsenicicoccus bolidensis TaxID=229480 RepID=UPI0028ABD4D0|nr:OmpA family protein [Arsenicicoccus bolidensis]